MLSSEWEEKRDDKTQPGGNLLAAEAREREISL
jgi:hypothetical protein